MANPKNYFNSETGRKAAAKANTPEAIAKKNQTKAENRLVKGAIYSQLRKSLLEPVTEKGNKPFYQDFLEKVVKEAKKDPNSPSGQILIKQIFQDDIITQLDAEVEKYINRDIDLYQFRLQKKLFQKQKDVFNDFISRRIVEMCSRRAGKTESNVDVLLKFCAIPDSPCVYINLTFDNAIKQCFDKVLEEASRVDLPIKKKSKSEGYIEFQNGSSILFKGNKDKSEADKLRGYHFRCAIIDEAGHQCNMQYLVDDVIGPALMDFEDSVLYLTGTPPRRKGTYFESAFNNKKWTSFHWTMAENPYIKNVENEIQRICEEKGLTPDSSYIKREYFGEMAYDTEAQAFKGYKVYSGQVPQGFVPDHIYCGVDFGFADFNGVCVLAADVENKLAYSIYERKFNKATVSQIVDVIRYGFETGKKFLLERNQFAELSNCAIFTDSNEKSITYELSQTYGLPAYCAYKYDRAMAMEQLAEYNRTGRILIQEDGPIADEYEQILYKRDDLDNITSELDDGYHPDITMAELYAARQFFYDCGLDAGGESKNKQTGEF
ncbi:MAG: terminase family protein [Treponema sp.]|nr:terminase family protein [Treponema sp.]